MPEAYAKSRRHFRHRDSRTVRKLANGSQYTVCQTSTPPVPDPRTPKAVETNDARPKELTR